MQKQKHKNRNKTLRVMYTKNPIDFTSYSGTRNLGVKDESGVVTWGDSGYSTREISLCLFSLSNVPISILRLEP